MQKALLYNSIKSILAQHKPKVYTLLIALGASFSILWATNQHYAAKNAQIGSKEADLETLSSVLAKKQEQLEAARSNEDSVQNYLLVWSPYLIKDLSPMRVLETLVSLANKQGLEVAKQSTSQTPSKGNYDMANIALSLVGNLKDIIAWMSTSEAQMPLMHINHLEINERGNVLILDIDLQYPLIY